jgi:6-pyruvoyltetrahydropterin/6-carboxytetrahydropterin synthase
LHGHNYEVELYLESPVLNDVGFVRDYGELSRFKTWIDNTFDHRQINDTIAQPTAENMAKVIYERAVALYLEVTAVRVSETPKTTAWYSPHSLPPLDTVLDVFESLAGEPPSNPDRQRLVDALTQLLPPRFTFGMGGPGGAAYATGRGSVAVAGAGGGGGRGAAYGPGAQGGAGGAGGSVYFGGGGSSSYSPQFCSEGGPIHREGCGH